MRILINHVQKFIEKGNLVLPSRKVVVAVSAGMDSMALLHVIQELTITQEIQGLRVFHVNHGTREENQQEEELVESFCKKRDIPLIIHRLKFDLKVSNFEDLARKMRYKFFFENLQPDEVLFTAHHLDDSFEWSLLKQFKSPHPNSFLGIPVKNGPVRRPFLCVTKNQIRALVLKCKIPYLEDKSNKNERFERNYLREKVVSVIGDRFPNYLKHYVQRSNEIAFNRNLSVFGKNRSSFHIFKDEFNGHFLTTTCPKDFGGAEENIRKIIHRLSRKERGSLNTQIEKLVKAVSSGKRGPMNFSGGVEVFMSPNQLYFISKFGRDLCHRRDLELLNNLRNKQILFQTLKFETLMNANYCFLRMVLSPQMPSSFPSLKIPHPLFPLSSSYALEEGLWVNTYSKLLLFCNYFNHPSRNLSFQLYIN